MSDIVLKFNEPMRRLMAGGWVDACQMALGREVVESVLGPGGIAMRHFNARQGSWPGLSRRTLRDRRKTDKRIFVGSGRTLATIRKPADKATMLGWGSSADVKSGQALKKRYYSGGVYATASGRRDGLTVKVGFAGVFKHSKGFTAERKRIAAKRGIDPRNTKAVKRAVSVAETRRSLRGKGVAKYAAMGALGISNPGTKGAKMVKARGNNNFAHANIVQAGPFIGGTNLKTGAFLSPAQLRASGLKRGEYETMHGKHPRPLLPLDEGDVPVLRGCMERAVTQVFRQLEGGH